MSQQNAIYISLGSNQGDRLKHLQQAVDFIFKRIGNIQLIAKVYNTPALGFDGPNFLNTCLVVRSDMSAQTAMETLLDIEKQMGRERANSGGYESRIIDLDMLMFNEAVPNLQLFWHWW